MNTQVLKYTKKNIKIAAEIIKNGGLVAFPTETVYGLGADALNESAVKKVYAAKGRPSDNPMIVHISSRDDLTKLALEITQDMELIMGAFWPGPMTMVVRKKSIVPLVTTGGLDTVAVRMPNNQIALDLITQAGVPIAAPSANISGKPSPTSAEHVIDDLEGKIDAILVGENCKVGIESTVIDMTEEIPMILRPGIITAEAFSEVLKKEIGFDPTLLLRPDEDMFNNNEFKPKAPGMKYKHYAPDAEMIIYEGKSEKVRKQIEIAKKNYELKGLKVGVIFYEDSDSEEAAHDLFAELRKFDKEGMDVILAASLKEKGLGLAVMNRMLKSAGYNIIKID